MVVAIEILTHWSKSLDKTCLTFIISPLFWLLWFLMRALTCPHGNWPDKRRKGEPRIDMSLEDRHAPWCWSVKDMAKEEVKPPASQKITLNGSWDLQRQKVTQNFPCQTLSNFQSLWDASVLKRNLNFSLLLTKLNDSKSAYLSMVGRWGLSASIERDGKSFKDENQLT